MTTKRKVLIVDDERDLVDMLAMRLEADGRFEVGTALSGEEALSRAISFRPDVVLLDSVMPGLDGWQVCRRLREDTRTKRAAVVIMTAGSPAEAKRKAEEAGADQLVIKPYDQTEVVEVVGKIKGGRS